LNDKTETELSLASDAEVRKWDERDRADEEYFMMLEKAAVMRESADEQLLIKKPWTEYFMMLEKAAVMRESADEQLLIKKPWSERFWNDK